MANVRYSIHCIYENINFVPYTANALGQKLEIIISKPVYFRNAVKKIRKILGLTFPPKNIGPLHNIFLDTNSKIALIQPLLFFTMIFPNVHY